VRSQPENDNSRVLGWTEHSAARLRQAVKAFGPASSVAEKAGISRNSLNSIMSGASTPKVGTIRAIVDVIGASADDFIDADAADVFDVGERPVEIEGAILIPEIDLAYGLGATFVDGFPVAETARYFPTDWVRRYSSAPVGQLRFAPGRGNSMSPTIDDGDIMLIDLSETRPSFADLIWVCAIGEMGMVKRLATRADGTIVIKSDNPSVRDDTAVDGEIHIIGRVVAVIKKT
jgi:transcriptional regulator with XRE-family HTH domain